MADQWGAYCTAAMTTTTRNNPTPKGTPPMERHTSDGEAMTPTTTTTHPSTLPPAVDSCASRAPVIAHGAAALFFQIE
jgi:hypothetical protein